MLQSVVTLEVLQNLPVKKNAHRVNSQVLIVITVRSYTLKYFIFNMEMMVGAPKENLINFTLFNVCLVF